MRTVRLSVLSVVVAGAIEATSGDVEPDWLYAVIVPMWIGGLGLIGYLGDWRGLCAFLAAYAAAIAIHTAFFYERDPACVEWCGDPNAASFLFVGPFLLVPVALGVLMRSRSTRFGGMAAAQQSLPD